MAIAPTSNLANVSGCVAFSIEPVYKNLFVKSNVVGEFTVLNTYLINELKSLSLWDQTMLERLKAEDGSVQNIAEIPQKIKDKYKESFDIHPFWVIKHAAYRGKWIDQSQSVNIFTETVSGKDLSDIYETAWMMGLKSTYYLRTLGASSIEKSSVKLGNGNGQTKGTAVINGAKVASQSNGLREKAEENTQLKALTCLLDDGCEACQ
jgi:ribonucleoside-diphosphate reductase alpha chain